MKFYMIGIMAILLLGCLPELEVDGELKVENPTVCTVIDTTQIENMACILGNDDLCLCPSEDSGVQKRCDEGPLPHRHHPPPLCEKK